MSATAILTEMRELVRQQTDNVVAGDHQAVLEVAMRHEHLLYALESAELDGSPEDMHQLVAEVQREKENLRGLLTQELHRTDFLLRLILGDGSAKPVAYPGTLGQGDSKPSRLNRRT